MTLTARFLRFIGHHDVFFGPVMHPSAHPRSTRTQLPSYLPVAGAVLLLVLTAVGVAGARADIAAGSAARTDQSLRAAGCDRAETCADPAQAGYRLIADGSFDLTRRLLPCRQERCPYPAILRPHERADVASMRASVGFLEARSSYTFKDVLVTANTPAALRDSLRRIVDDPHRIALVEGKAWRGGVGGTTVLIQAHRVVARPIASDRSGDSRSGMP